MDNTNIKQKLEIIRKSTIVELEELEIKRQEIQIKLNVIDNLFAEAKIIDTESIQYTKPKNLPITRKYKKKREYTSTLITIAELTLEEVNKPMTIKQIAEYAVSKGLWENPPKNYISSLTCQLSRNPGKKIKIYTGERTEKLMNTKGKIYYLNS